MQLNPDHPFYAWGGLNHGLFLWVNRWHSPTWDGLMLWATAAGNHANYPFYLAAALFVSHFRPCFLPGRNVLVFALGYVLTSEAVIFLKPFLDFPRPLLALGPQLVHVVGRPEWHHSFPSGHSVFAVLLAASLASGTSPGLKWLLWLFAALVCLSRMVLGAHFPADVLGGALIGGITALLLHWTLARLPAGGDKTRIQEE